MGLFDFLWRRNPAPPPYPASDSTKPPEDPSDFELDLSPEKIEELVKGYPQSREDHYQFAHFALRSFALGDPLQYLAALASDDRDDFLKFVYDKVRERTCDAAPTPSFRVEDVGVHLHNVNGFPCAMIEMPTPQGITECYFTLLIVFVDLNAPIPSELAAGDCRYFTLEAGFSLDDPARLAPRTVLCEWTHEGEHLNYGDGPAPHSGDFLGAVAKAIAATRRG